jgi:hypothetical protein
LIRSAFLSIFSQYILARVAGVVGGLLHINTYTEYIDNNPAAGAVKGDSPRHSKNKES